MSAQVLACSDHRQFYTLMTVSVLALPPLVPGASPSCSRLVTVVPDLVTETQRLKNASPAAVPTRLVFLPQFPPACP